MRGVGSVLLVSVVSFYPTPWDELLNFYHYETDFRFLLNRINRPIRVGIYEEAAGR